MYTFNKLFSNYFDIKFEIRKHTKSMTVWSTIKFIINS